MIEAEMDLTNAEKFYEEYCWDELEIRVKAQKKNFLTEKIENVIQRFP